LKGATRTEREAGYVTAIPSGVKINSLSIKNGVAKVDFNKELEPGGGSCAVAAIRAQIEATLRQFSTVKSVALSIDGKSGGEILQP
jgi:germination protein M